MSEEVKIRKDARECPNFGKAFTGNKFQKPNSCMRNGYGEVCAMRGKCVFASHLYAKRWAAKRHKKTIPSKIDFQRDLGESANAVRVSPFRRVL